jgi:hypothetical protein
VRFPLVVKPNVGGSGAGIVRFATREDLVQRLDTLDFGPDGTALVQEYIESAEDAIVRVEVLDGQYLYAIRIVRQADAGFNLCPADICQVPPAAPSSAAPSSVPSDLGACLPPWVVHTPGRAACVSPGPPGYLALDDPRNRVYLLRYSGQEL